MIIAPATVRADAQAWWELVSGDGVLVDQGPGKTLVIEKDVAPGVYEFEFVMKAMGIDVQLAGQSSDLWYFGNENIQTLGIEHLAPWSIQLLDGINGDDPLQGNDPAKLVANAAQAANVLDPIFPPGAVVPLLSWTIQIQHDQPTQPATTNELFYGIGRSLWVTLPFDPNNQDFLHMGTNVPIPLNNESVLPLPIITIINVPEQQSIVLLSATCLILIIRRPRRCSSRIGAVPF